MMLLSAAREQDAMEKYSGSKTVKHPFSIRDKKIEYSWADASDNSQKCASLGSPS